MNKIFKVIWNEARNAYVVVSEIAKNHGSKSCSTKKLLAMLIATGVMTCASFDVLAEKPVAATTAAQQYVALKAVDFKDEPTIFNKDSWKDSFGGDLLAAHKEWKAQQDGKKQIGKYTYTYDGTNKYWVRDGYVLTVDENGGKYTQLSDNAIRADVAYNGTSVPKGILQSVTSTVAHNGVVTHSGDSLQKITAGSYAGVSNSGGTEVAGSWNYIINDSSWENSDAEYKDGYVDLVDLKGDKMPRGFKTTDSGLNWDEVKQTYTYQGKAVDYRNMYVIDGKLGVFTNADGSEVYTGTVYGKHNEILMTVKDNGKFYSYWAASVTDPSVTMETYPVSKYNSDLAVIDQNIKDLNKDIIKEVTLTKDTNSAIIRLVRNGGNAVDGAITVTSGGDTDGKDTFVKISNAADTEGKNFATGSKVEAIVDNGATTGIKINGEDYTIKSGSKVSVTQNADEKTTTITVDGKATTITDTDTHNALESASLSGKTLTITGKDGDKASVDLSPIDTDTTYTAGNGIAIDKTNKNAISVKLKEGENNLEVTEAGLALKKDLTVNRVAAGNFYMSTAGIGYGNKAYITSSGLNANSQKITGVAAGEVSSTSTDAINGSQLHAVKTELQTSDKHLVGNPASADSYYKPDANGDISLRVEDQNKNGYDVVIKDVASKAELGDVANRVTNVENKVTQIETDVTTIKTDITTIKTDINNINTRVDNVEALAGKHTTLEKNGTNINVEETVVDGQKNYKVNLNKDITLGDENGNNVSISGTNGTITATGDITTANRINAANGGKLADIDVTGNKLSNGNSSITLDGTNVKVNDKVTVDKDGKISGVAKGDISNTSTDAVNGSQLYDTNTHITNVENQVISNSNRINQLGNRVNKVGAGAAALAALHPMDFDPDDKLTFSAGYGNYGGENAAAIGAYYRPDEKVMFSVGGTVGNGENMVNAGVSFALDRTNHVSNSRTALAREVIDLRGQLAVMGAKMAKMEKALGMLDETKTKLFPDIPANHWAYEYIAKLAGNGYIEGYPDGNFGGDRLMTRYEFAAMLYRAIENGAALEEKIIKEFEPELGRIRVDRISGEDGDRDKIERVRVNDTKGERDHYGNKVAK